MPPESDKDNGVKADTPSQGDVHPETDFFCQLMGCQGLSQEQALSYISVLKAWFGTLLDGYAKQEDLQDLSSRIDALENDCVKKDDLIKTLVNGLRPSWWTVFRIIGGIIAFLAAMALFFWEKIHPILAGWQKTH